MALYRAAGEGNLLKDTPRAGAGGLRPRAVPGWPGCGSGVGERSPAGPRAPGRGRWAAGGARGWAAGGPRTRAAGTQSRSPPRPSGGRGVVPGVSPPGPARRAAPPGGRLPLGLAPIAPPRRGSADTSACPAPPSVEMREKGPGPQSTVPQVPHGKRQDNCISLGLW